MGDTGYRNYEYFECNSCSTGVHINEENLVDYNEAAGEVVEINLKTIGFSCLFDACDGELVHQHREGGTLIEVPREDNDVDPGVAFMLDLHNKFKETVEEQKVIMQEKDNKLRAAKREAATRNKRQFGTDPSWYGVED